MNNIEKQLPENLNPQYGDGFIIMDLKEARKFFGINFKTSFWSKLNPFKKS